jgi:hypothetical protein
MEQSPCKADRHPAGKYICFLFVRPEVSLPCSQEPVTEPYPS